MSQWNNSYAYNQQYQGSGTWNGELGNQFSNQQYYPNAQPTYEPSNQYVNFQEFLSQMQGNNAAASGSIPFNNSQYQNYPSNQYEYQTAPSPQNPNNYYPPRPNAVSAAEGYQATAQGHDRNAPESNYGNHMVFKSNLTPTATEFVPKGLSQSGPSGTVNKIHQICLQHIMECQNPGEKTVQKAIGEESSLPNPVVPEVMMNPEMIKNQK